MRSLMLFLTVLIPLSTPLSSAAEVGFAFQLVGDPGNACDPQSQGCFGAVAEPYRIASNEVQTSQWVEFLNAIATTDTNSVYAGFESNIDRTGAPGSYVYSSVSGLEFLPVSSGTFWAFARFANWLHNGQPTGAQDATTTEDGAYTLTPATIANNTVIRNPGAQVFIPSEDEWYKAAYYDPVSQGYFDYPAGTDTPTTCSTIPTGVSNTANCGFVAGFRTIVGRYQGSRSPNATLDQGGNAAEWTETIISGTSRVFRGGNYINGASTMAASSQNSAAPASQPVLVGFRVGTPAQASGLSLSDLTLVYAEDFEGEVGFPTQPEVDLYGVGDNISDGFTEEPNIFGPMAVSGGEAHGSISMEVPAAFQRVWVPDAYESAPGISNSFGILNSFGMRATFNSFSVGIAPADGQGTAGVVAVFGTDVTAPNSSVDAGIFVDRAISTTGITSGLLFIRYAEAPGSTQVAATVDLSTSALSAILSGASFTVEMVFDRETLIGTASVDISGVGVFTTPSIDASPIAGITSSTPLLTTLFLIGEFLGLDVAASVEDIEVFSDVTLGGSQVRIQRFQLITGILGVDVVTAVDGFPEVSCPGAFDLCNADIPGGTMGEFDIEGTTLTLNVGSGGGSTVFPAPFDGFQISLLDWNVDIQAVTLTTDIPGLTDANINFDTDIFSVNLSGLTVGPGQFFTVEIIPSAPPPDADLDGVEDSVDNCPMVANPGQVNTDADLLGDACDDDDDNDGLLDFEDANALNPDADFDGFDDGMEVTHGSDPFVPGSIPAHADPTRDACLADAAAARNPNISANRVGQLVLEEKGRNLGFSQLLPDHLLVSDFTDLKRVDPVTLGVLDSDVTPGAVSGLSPVGLAASGSDTVYEATDSGLVQVRTALVGGQLSPPLWTVDTKRPTCGDQILAAPVVADRTYATPAFQTLYSDDLVFAGTAYTSFCPGAWDQDNTIWALNSTTGAVEFTFNEDTGSGAPHDMSRVGGLALDEVNDLLFATSDRDILFQHTLWAIDTLTGTRVWSINADAVSGPPMLNGDRVYSAETEAAISAWDKATGTSLWTITYSTSIVLVASKLLETPAGDVLIASILANGDVWLVRDEVSFGSEVWTVTLPGGALPSAGALVFGLGSENLFVGASDGRIYQLDLATGAIEASRLASSNGSVDQLAIQQDNGTSRAPSLLSTTSDGAAQRFCQPFRTNTTPVDTDGDGITDGADNCPADSNPFQADADQDGLGDACDPFWLYDQDFDGLFDFEEDLNGNGIVDPGETDPQNPDTDGDGFGDWEEVNGLCGTACAAFAMIAVDFTNPVINSGPVSFGLPTLPANPIATIAVSPGTPVGGGITSYGLGDVLSANLVFGDGTFVNLVAFDMQVLSNGTISSLSYTFAPLDTPSVSAGIIVLNSPLHITGTDIISGNPFSYTYANSVEIFMPSTPPAVPGLSVLGIAGLTLLVFSLGGWMLTRRSGVFGRA